MNLLEYLESKPEKFIPGKTVAEALDLKEREVRDIVKQVNLSLIQSGQHRLIVSNNGKPNGYCCTSNPEKLEHYYRQQYALGRNIMQNATLARIMLNRLRTTAKPKKVLKELPQLSMFQ